MNYDSVASKEYLQNYHIDAASYKGFKISRYGSGEMVGSFFYTGLQSRFKFDSRSGEVVTRKFTRASKQQIRRAVQCSKSFLRYFCTLTFAPSCLMPWHLQDGQVRHDYAKWKLKKILDACSRRQRRLNRVLHYLWVAERQQNGNIHFHILWDQFFPIHYLTKIWKQASNSVDIVRVNNPLHAARYMQKYMTKEQNSEIKGNRYFISKKLRNDMMPVEDVLINVPSMSINPPDSQCLKEVRQFLSDTREYIESSGGFLLDFGFNIPPPAAPSKWTCKRTGKTITSRGVSPVIAKQLYSALYDMTEPLPF